MTQDRALEVLKTGANVFLTGEPGAGKTYTIDLFKAWMKEEEMAYAITASTGIAASHLDGSTIHSWSGLGIRRGLRKEQLDGITYNTWIVERIKPISVLVIDEISMLDAVLLDDVSNILKAVHNNGKPFGGIQVVLVGDFFQLPPVARDGEKKEFAFNAQSWIEANMQVCYLTEQHRQSDAEFLGILTAMRAGTVTDEQKARLKACTMTKKPDTKLYTHNADVDRLNNEELAKLKGQEKKYEMSESGDPKFIETLKKQCLSPEILKLKEGAVVMFTRNNFKEGYVNGTIGKVTGFTGGGAPIVKTLEGKTIVPVAAEWSYSTRRRGQVASIKQIPLRLAWAITVHKSQGMSLDAAEVDLGGTFEFGQGYVAISRVRSLEGLHLTDINDLAFAMHPEVVAKDKEFREAGV
jgi:ATP-dependent exoDNAse (exonuclease V) alpha subunit